MSALAPIADKLGKLIPLLGSPVDGEALSAVRAIDRTLKSAGRDWHDLASALNPRIDATTTVRSPKPPTPPEPIDRDDVMAMARAVAEHPRASGAEARCALMIILNLNDDYDPTPLALANLRRAHHRLIEVADELLSMARAVAEAGRSTDWEREFAASIASRLERGSRLTGKQQRCLRRIYHKVTSE